MEKQVHKLLNNKLKPNKKKLLLNKHLPLNNSNNSNNKHLSNKFNSQFSNNNSRHPLPKNKILTKKIVELLKLQLLELKYPQFKDKFKEEKEENL